MYPLADVISTSDIVHILQHVHAGIAIVDRDGTLLSWNSVFNTSLKSQSDVKNLGDLFPTREREWLQIKIAGRVEEQWVGEFPLHGRMPLVLCECKLLPLSNEYMAFIVEHIETQNTLLELVDKLNRQVRLFQVESEHSKKIARNKQIELESVIAQANEVAQTDALTILLNRRAIIRELQDEVLRAERYGTMLSVSILDVDHFKVINDTYGHTIGDEVLRLVAEGLRDGIRSPDIVGRYGGEEFIIILPNSDANAASEQAARLCKQINESPLQAKGYAIQVTFSIGVAQLRHGKDTWDILLNRADTAMYEAKNRGRNCWVVAE